MSQSQRQRSIRELIGPDFGWLAAQFLLLATAAIAGPLGLVVPGRRDLLWPRVISAALGLAAIVGALVIAGQARRDLGESLRVSPTPLDDAQLVEHGWYARVRHPLYLAVLLGLLGWSLLWFSVPALGVTIAGAAFFSLKARHEEGLLVDRYANCEEYMSRVRARFVPRIW